MGADNWDVCPRCRRRKEDEHCARVRKAEKAYGNVSVDEYKALLSEAERGVDEEEYTLREDYEVGMTDNDFYVYYNAGCSECKWTYKYSHNEKHNGGMAESGKALVLKTSEA